MKTEVWTTVINIDSTVSACPTSIAYTGVGSQPINTAAIDTRRGATVINIDSTCYSRVASGT